MCCSRGDASESVSVSDMDWRSQASTVVPLESVDAIVQSASALAVEALKLGRNDEAQRIIRCARLLHENSGVSGRSSSCGSSSAPSPRLPGPIAAPEQGPQAASSDERLRPSRAQDKIWGGRSGMVSALRELAVLVLEDDRLASSRLSPEHNQRDNYDDLARSQSLPNIAARVVPTHSHLGGRLSSTTTSPPFHAGATSSLGAVAPAAQARDAPVVHVYGTAIFGHAVPSLAVSGTAQAEGGVPNVAKERSSTNVAGCGADSSLTIAGHDPALPLYTQARLLLESGGLRNRQLGLTQHMSATSASTSRPFWNSAGDVGGGRQLHAPDVGGDRAGDRPGSSMPGCVRPESRLSMISQASTAWDGIDLDKPPSPGPWPLGSAEPREAAAAVAVAGAGRRGARGEASAQSLEDTIGLKSLIRLAASRRHDARAARDATPDGSSVGHERSEGEGEDSDECLDSFVRALMTTPRPSVQPLLQESGLGFTSHASAEDQGSTSRPSRLGPLGRANSSGGTWDAGQKASGGGDGSRASLQGGIDVVGERKELSHEVQAGRGKAGMPREEATRRQTVRVHDGGGPVTDVGEAAKNMRGRRKQRAAAASRQAARLAAVREVVAHTRHLTAVTFHSPRQTSLSQDESGLHNSAQSRDSGESARSWFSGSSGSVSSSEASGDGAKPGSASQDAATSDSNSSSAHARSKVRPQALRGGAGALEPLDVAVMSVTPALPGLAAPLSVSRLETLSARRCVRTLGVHVCVFVCACVHACSCVSARACISAITAKA